MSEPAEAADPGPPAGPGRDGRTRFRLLAGVSKIVPVALVLGLLGTATAPNRVGRMVFGGGTAAIGLLWALSRRRAPVLELDGAGYRVLEGAREILRVSWAEVRSARAVPAERAMYVDCGDPARNLLLPSRHGYGFRFDRQDELYVLLARRLDGRLEIADALAPPDRSPAKSAP